MAKKKRTPAQIRATKKLIAFNKRRRALKRKTNPKVKRKATKKRVVKRRTTSSTPKRRTTRRKTSSSRKLYYIMVRNKRTGRKGYYSGNSFSTSMTKALLSNSKSEMVKLARKVTINRSQWHVYVGSK